LLIWHIDDAKANNREEWYPGVPYNYHMKVALMQADGLYELEHASGAGDAADPWPGSLNRTIFNGSSSPNSDGFGSGGSFVAVENIPSSSALMNIDVKVAIAASVDDDTGTLPNEFTLSQNYPNPFNPSTTIHFSLETSNDVRLDIYNLVGRHVTTLLNELVQAGPKSVTWDATDKQGEKVASGTYFYRLTVDDLEETKKMVLVK
jgi:hypothetical protein